MRELPWGGWELESEVSGRSSLDGHAHSPFDPNDECAVKVSLLTHALQQDTNQMRIVCAAGRDVASWMPS